MCLHLTQKTKNNVTTSSTSVLADTKLKSLWSTVAQTDSATGDTLRVLTHSHFSHLSPFWQVTVPVSLSLIGVVGVADRGFLFKGKSKIQRFFDRLRGHSPVRIDDYLQYAPFGSFVWAAEFPGVPHRHNFRDRLLLGATAYAVMGALLIVLVRILLRTTAGYPRSAALFAVPGFLLTSWLLAGASGIHSHWWTGTIGGVLIPLIGSVWFVASGYSRDHEAPSMQHWISGGLKLGGLSVVVLVAASFVASVIALVAGWSRMEGIQELLC